MKVWIVMGSIPYEGDFVVSVHATKAQAEAAAETERADESNNAVRFSADEWPVFGASE